MRHKLHVNLSMLNIIASPCVNFKLIILDKHVKGCVIASLPILDKHYCH